MSNLTHPHLDQFVNAIMRIPFNQLLGLRLVAMGAQEISLGFAMKQDLIGNFLHGILHGGVISAVLDMAGGMVVMLNAIHKHADKNVDEIVAVLSKSSTVDLQVSYLNPGRGEDFIAKAFLIKSGNKLSFTRMELWNQDSRLIATANATYLVG